MKQFLILAACLSTALFAPILRAEEVLFEQAEEAEVQVDTPFSRNVEIMSLQGGREVILQFKAWYRHKVPAGFYGNLNVYWNGQRVTTILDRPETVYVEGLEREFKVGTPNGWMTAILPDAGAAEMPSRYYIPRETLDIVNFRFRVPVDKPGIYPLEIRSSLKNQNQEYYDTLIIADLKVIQADE